MPGEWLDQAKAFPIDNGAATVKVSDGGNCFNLNSLVTQADDGERLIRPIAVRQFEALMTILGVQPRTAGGIAQAAADWIDSDTSPQSGGAEDETYARATIPYRAANALMSDVPELRAVAGVDPAIYERIRPWVCALPVAELSPLNINTLRRDQAPLVAMLLPDKLSLAFAQRMIDERPPTGYSAVENFWSIPALRGISPPVEVMAQTQIKTRWFALEMQIELGGAELNETALIDGAMSSCKDRTAKLGRRRMSGFVVFLGEDALPWLQVEDGSVVAHGDDLRDCDEVVTAIVPANSITYRNASFEELSPAQALAAARLDAAEFSLGGDRHVAVAEAGDYYVVTEKAKMQDWLARLAMRGLRATAIIPSPSLLPVPASGFVRAELPHETVLRSADAALGEDGVISAMIVGDAPVTTMGQGDFEEAAAAAAEYPPLNLLQGDFASRTDWGAIPGYWRRMAGFVALLAGLTLAIPMAEWTRLTLATAALDDQSATIAAKALGEARASDDAVERLQDKLVDQRGGGAGFLATQAAVVGAIESTPGVELSSLSFDPEGTMHAMIRATSAPETDALRRAIEARDFAVTESAQAGSQGRAEVEFQVRPR